MICAAISNLTIPGKWMNANWETALDWLRAEKWKDLPEGKTEIDGDRVYVSHTKYKSKPVEECRYETHQRYADIQILLNGVELVDVCARDALNVTVPYSAEKDIDFLDGSPDVVHRVALSYPLALVLFPEDAHKPCIAPGNPADVEKIVLKVALK